MYDNESPPGSWKNELSAAPWGYGQNQNQKVRDALASMRQRGMWTEASVLETEITTLKAEIGHLMERLDEVKRDK
jgi:hypothetical protein